MDGNQLADSDHCDCNANATVTIKVLSGWLDAPTCEGWWWFIDREGGCGIADVDSDGGVHLVGIESIQGLDYIKCFRWFGPLVPPSVVSEATSSGASV